MAEPTGWSFDAGVSPISDYCGGQNRDDDSSILGSPSRVRKAARGDPLHACSTVLQQQLVATAMKNTSEEDEESSDELLADDSLLEVDSTVRAAEIQLRSIANELKREQLLAEAARREARTLELQGILTDAQQKTASSPGSAAGRKSRTAKSEPERERSTSHATSPN